MVSQNLKMSPHKVVTQFFQRHHYCNKFPIGGTHVLLSLRHALAKKLNRMPTGGMQLLENCANAEVAGITDQACFQRRVEQLESGGTH